MGKRELLIILAFVVLGAAAYQLTAPPDTNRPRRFSLSNVLSNMRREIRGNPASATVTVTGSAPAKGLTELRVANAQFMAITGEAREDIAWEMVVESNGPDEATAEALAKRTILKQDDLGSALGLRVTYPPEARQTARLTLKVPASLAVRIDGPRFNSEVHANHLAAIQLDAIGDVTIENVTGAVTGTHRTGELKVTDAQSVGLTLVSSSAELRGVRGTMTINARNGSTSIEQASGNVEIDENNNEVKLTGVAGTTRVVGTGGTVTIENPRGEVKVDVRRSEVEIAIDKPIAVTALTTDEPLRLLVDDESGVMVDALASDGGTIQGKDFSLAPEQHDQETRVIHTFGGTTRVSLRNQRGEIVLRRRK